MVNIFKSLATCLLASMVLVACGGDEPIDPTPTTPTTPVNPPTQEKDTTAPTITVSKSSVNVISGPSLTVSGNEMKIGSDLVASWKDDKSATCTVSITFTGKDGTTKAANSGDKLEEEGKLKLKVTDEAGNSSEAEITLTKSDSQAPEIEVKIAEKNVIAGVKVKVEGNQLFFDDQVAATWKDDFTENCKVEITLIPEEGESKAINSGDTIKEAGKLVILVQDDYDNKATAEITLTKTDSQAPTITVLIQEKNVIAGVKVVIDGNQLLFDEQVAASWTDDFSETCTVQMSLDGQAVNSGDVLQEAGKLVLAVSDDFKNEATAEIVLTAEAIFGLEGLKNLSIQVDKEVNLLQGITYADGVSLDKVEIEAQGNRVVVQDPSTYVPETPGIVDLIITVRAGSRALEFRVENLEVKGLEYYAPKMETADFIRENYSWYNEQIFYFREAKKDFIYDHILVSYYTSEWCKADNMEYIIFGETTLNIECENVGYENINEHSYHADQAYKGISSISPEATIKTCAGDWSYLEPYLTQHPEKMFMVSCAQDCLGAKNREDLSNDPNYVVLKRMLKRNNVIFSIVSGNVSYSFNRILNETEEEHEKGTYRSSSVNSEKDNKYIVVGYDPYYNNYFLDDCISKLPLGDFPRQDRLVDFISILNDGGASSFPTSQFSSTLGNHLSILMHNYPGTTLEGANTIMLDTYLWGQHLKYKDENDGTIKEGNLKYRIDTQKFIHNEIIHETEVKSALQNNPKSLPSTNGLYYEGKGIQFTVDGQTYDMTEENRATLENAVKSGKEITWIYNSDQAKKYGVTGENTITVRVMDTKARLIPDISLQVQVR